ncbi:glycosyltransferase family 9 protein [Cetobacterium sp. ZOR0034]|uniref:glycosyltransferase family 9 protein n=1 Tax=Cetobacterium sp. ZOR0034 TaxID=1339239 RepID=UPI000648292F|nr:glycosyltransferase family 9 protein [Cetobacterium sp. ZOR0034]
MIRKVNRVIQDFLRPIRLEIGKMIWDRKEKKSLELLQGDRVDMKKIKSILFLRYDGKIGDMVINTLLFREVKKVYPDIKIGVVGRGAAKDIIKFNPYVDEIYEYEKGKESSLGKRVRAEGYDVVIDFSEMLRVNQMKLINLCGGKINIGLDKVNWKLFDLSYKKSYDKHITDMYKNILRLLEIENPDLTYDIYSDEVVKNRIDGIVKNIDGDIVILNPYAASKHRSFNREKILEISKRVLKDEKNVLLFIGEPSKKVEIDGIIEKLNSNRVFYPELKGILDVAELISHAKYIVTPDTSIVHIAVAKGIPMTAVYRLDTEDNNSKVWGPNSKIAKQIFSKDVAKTGEEADINKFEVEEIGL